MVQLRWVLRRALAFLNTLEVWMCASCFNTLQAVPIRHSCDWAVLVRLSHAVRCMLDSNSWKFNDFVEVTQALCSVACFPQIKDTADNFRTVIKAGGIMDVVEQYPWNGQEQQYSCRDKRAGHHHGKVVKIDRGPAIQ